MRAVLPGSAGVRCPQKLHPSSNLVDVRIEMGVQHDECLRHAERPRDGMPEDRPPVGSIALEGAVTGILERRTHTTIR